MNESTDKRAVIVGLFISIGLVFLLAGILIVGNLRETFNAKMKLVSLFNDISGLQPGNNIWFSGVKIGTVSKIDFFGESQVEVSMNINKKAQKHIRKDAKVKISNDGLIGNKILIIYGGSSKSNEVQQGDTLEVEKTFTSDDMINTLQENNNNLLAITTNFKTLSNKLVEGEGTFGKLMNDNAVYDNINAATASLQSASSKAQKMVSALADFSSSLTKKGTLINELTTDTLVFNSVKGSVVKLQQIADTANLMVTTMKQAVNNPRSTIGVLLYDEVAGAHLKETMRNFESSSKKLDEDLEAAQHNFLLRGYFKKKEAKELKN